MSLTNADIHVKIASIKTKIAVQQNIMGGAQALSRAATIVAVRMQAEAQIRETTRTIEFLQTTLKQLEEQSRTVSSANSTAAASAGSSSHRNEGENYQNYSASASAGGRQGDSASLASSERTMVSNRPSPGDKITYSKLDLIKITTPYTPQRINYMLHLLAYKLSVETQLKKGSEAMARAITEGGGDKRARLAAEATLVESDNRIALLNRALRRYKNLDVFDEDGEDAERDAERKAGIRKPLSGTLYISISGGRDLDHISSAGRFSSAETVVVLKAEGNILATSKAVRNDSWRETFAIPIDNVNEMEINIYDRKTSGNNGADNSLVGVQWIRLDDLAEELRRKRVQEETAASWARNSLDNSNKRVASNTSGFIPSPVSSALPPPPSKSSESDAESNARMTSTSTNPADGIQSWFNLEPVGNIYLSLQFVKSNARKRPINAGVLRRQDAVRKRKDLGIEQNGHRFVSRQFVSIVLCALCGEFLRVGQGYSCAECNFTCHKECHSKVITQCVSSPREDRDEDQINHRIPHRWGAITSISANWCCHCGHMLPLVSKSARKCSDCQLACHADCASLVPDFCGMSMLRANELLAVMKSIAATKQNRNSAIKATPPTKSANSMGSHLSPDLTVSSPPRTPPMQVESLSYSAAQIKLSDQMHAPPSQMPPHQAKVDGRGSNSPSSMSQQYSQGSMSNTNYNQSVYPPGVSGYASQQLQQQQMSQVDQSRQQGWQKPPSSSGYAQTGPTMPSVPYETTQPQLQSQNPRWATQPQVAQQPRQQPPPAQQIAVPQDIYNAGAMRQQAAIVPSVAVNSKTAQYPTQSTLQPPVQVSVGAKKITLDQFNFLAVLGKGNFGKVMLAEEKSTSTLYAIKVLKKAAILEDDSVEGMHLEKRAFLSAAKHRHPFLLELHSTFQTSTRVYFVMGFAGGGDLMIHVQRAQFTPRRTKFYAAEVLLGLEYFHSQGIIYRDLKLENIMLSMDGHIKIADYGLCKEGMWQGVKTNTMCGTPEFMAPEIVAQEPYGREVDWWSFAVLIYEMLLCTPPFRGDDEEEIYEAILGDTVMYPQQMPAHSVDLLNKLFVRIPSKRLGSGPGDAADIKRHPYFGDINFVDLYNKRITPPYIPANSGNPLDAFDEEFTKEAPALSPSRRPTLQEQDAFAGFSWSAEWAGTNAGGGT